MTKREPKLGDIVIIRGSDHRAVVVEYDTKASLYGVFWVHAGAPNGAKVPVTALDVVDETPAPAFNPDAHPAVVEKLAALGQAIAEVRASGIDATKVVEELAALKRDAKAAVERSRQLIPTLPTGATVSTAVLQLVDLAATWKREGNEQIERLQARVNDLSAQSPR